MRPRCEVMFRCGEIDCADCEITVAGNECECGVYDFSKDDRIAALLDALKELGVEVPQWMPIDSAPKDGTPVLVVKAPYLPCVCEWADTYGWIEPDEEIEWGKESNYKPTHWMPLPTKPKE